MSSYFTEISLSASYPDLPQLLDEIGRHANGLRLSARERGRLELAVEELFINTLQHGYKGTGPAAICITLKRDASSLKLVYSDNAPAFDPTTAPTDQDDKTAIGGLGLTLLHGISRSMRYQRQGTSNRVEIDFLLSAT